ncbi:DNA repair protein RecN [Ornithinimicrobium cryptoxanthini]|uniref:DNA repair protein RecN n=1 Tax=Ornithinimicrobium cryptoxanthini TaxID=2934161 RepID=A0ABY4YE32_9MICO|nr:DNA repair protein RecN [Ornithinimicrobium cryptoxanthini]USQ75009.1 DNA repair protein RecN [Ornithinimicrobium cryptoxanthini]
MLTRIRIQRLGVIEDAELELSPGLNVITGETGAGKTMVVSGLGLLFGARADAGMVRAGAASAVVEGEVDVPQAHPAAARVEAAGGETQDGLILVRTVSAEGRSRAHVGGRAAPVGVLSEVGQHLMAVHGQADQWRLRAPDQHRVLLDAFGGAAVHSARDAYATAHRDWHAAREELVRLSSLGAERTLRVNLLRAALEEIEAIDPQEGEEDDLRTEEQRLAHADGLRQAAETAHTALTGGDDTVEEIRPVTELLATASQTLGPVAEHDPALAGLRQRLDELGYLAADLATELAAYSSDIEVDPARLAGVQERRSVLTGLLRRYGESSAAVLAWARDAAGEVAELDGADDRIAALTQDETRLREAVVAAGAELTRVRQAAAADLGRKVEAELAHLAMGSARLEVSVTQRPDEQGLELADGQRVRAWAHGLDEVEIMLAANAGAQPRTVTKAASGGELSRVMLALEVVSAQGDVPTYVFDEVDAGVGGAAALDLGARLALLARTAQVVVVTHLGQVAAFADRHHVVHKSSDGVITASDVSTVDGADRVAEIARMLGGVTDSAAALEHARELVEEHAPQRLGR